MTNKKKLEKLPIPKNGMLVEMSQRLVFNISIFPQRNKHINPDFKIEAYDICSDIAKYEPNLTDTFD